MSSYARFWLVFILDLVLAADAGRVKSNLTSEWGDELPKLDKWGFPEAKNTSSAELEFTNSRDSVEKQTREYYRLAASEAKRYGGSGLGMWRAMTPELQVVLNTRCTEEGERASESCGNRVIKSIQSLITTQAPHMSDTDASALAFRAAYACGQGMSNTWYVHVGMLGSVAEDQRCMIYITPGTSLAKVNIATIDHKMFRESICKDSYWSECPRTTACIRNEITGAELGSYGETHWAILDADKMSLKEAEQRGVLWYTLETQKPQGGDRSLDCSAFQCSAHPMLSDCFDAKGAARVHLNRVGACPMGSLCFQQKLASGEGAIEFDPTRNG